MDSLERIIGFDAQLLFDSAITAFAVLILFAALSYLIFNPAKKALSDRKARILADITAAKQDKDVAAASKAEYDAKLKEVEKEAGLILEEARKKAKLLEEEIILAAKDEAVRMKNRAEREIELDRKKAMDEIRGELVALSALIAQKAVQDTMNVQVSSRLIDDTLKEIGKSTWQS